MNGTLENSTGAELTLGRAALQLAIRLLKALHLVSLLFLLFGFLSPLRSILWLHLLFVPGVVLQWRLNRGTCLLTNLENRLSGTGIQKSRQQGQFIKGILRLCFDPLPPDPVIKFWLYALIWSSWSATLLRITAL